MKQLLRLKTMLLLCALMAGAGSVWGEEKYLEITISNFTEITTNYTSKFTHNYTVEGETLPIEAYGVYKNNSGIQMNSGKGTYIKNTTAFPGFITKIVATWTASGKNSPTLYVSSGSTASTSSTKLGKGSNSVTVQTYTVENAATNRYNYFYFDGTTVTGACYLSSLKIYYDTDTRTEAGLAYSPISETLELDEAFTAPTFSNPNNLTVSFSSDNASVATVASDGTITFVGGLGTAIITASSEATNVYRAGEATFTINVVRKTPTLLVSNDLNMKSGTNVTIDDDIYQTNSDGDITISSNASSIVSVSNGKLNALAEGSATITVSVAQSDTYAAIEESFEITVTANAPVNPEGYGVGGSYSLVTNASTLSAGDKIIFVSSTNDGTALAMSTNQKENNREATDVTVYNTEITTISNSVQIVTLEGSSGAWYFNVGSGYLYAASSSKNYMRTEAEADDNAKASITINTSTGKATITFQGSYTHNKLCSNISSNLFSCYSSAQNDVYIFRQNAATSLDITIGTSGWRTLVSAQNVSLPSGVKAYTVTASSTSSATLTEVTSIKANNPYLLNGPVGECTLTIIDNPAEPTGNLLQVSTATTGNGVYVLANKSNGVGFYKWNGGYLGAGRVYLPAPAAGAREFLSFDDEATGINAVNGEGFTVNGSVYNLSGQRVAQPSKGLYIINGKKVLVK